MYKDPFFPAALSTVTFHNFDHCSARVHLYCNGISNILDDVINSHNVIHAFYMRAVMLLSLLAGLESMVDEDFYKCPDNGQGRHIPLEDLIVSIER